jgi:hypothetical protein
LPSSSRIKRLSRFAVALVCSYLVAWHLAFAIVMRYETTFFDPHSRSFRERLAFYSDYLIAMFQPGGELPSYVQMLTMLLTPIVLAIAYFARRFFRRSFQKAG